METFVITDTKVDVSKSDAPELQGLIWLRFPCDPNTHNTDATGKHIILFFSMGILLDWSCCWLLYRLQNRSSKTGISKHDYMHFVWILLVCYFRKYIWFLVSRAIYDTLSIPIPRYDYMSNVAHQYNFSRTYICLIFRGFWYRTFKTTHHQFVHELNLNRV